MQKARIYYRVSHSDQVRFGESLENQLELLRKYCKDNNYEIVGEYSDEGISGGSITKRKGLQLMLRDVLPGEIILFTKLDRFSRNLLDANIIVQELDKKNVGIKAILEDDIDTSSADGKFIFNLKLSLAQHERERTGERIRLVFERKKIKGEVRSGKVPFGYFIKDKHAYIDEKRADMVRFLFETYISTRNLNQTKIAYNERYNVDKGNTTIRQMLKNKNYKGNATFPQIIDEDTFETVQGLLSKNYVRETHNKYMFSGLCVCSCGSRMSGSSNGAGYKYYKCNKRRCFTITEKKIEKLLINKLRSDMEETQYTEDFEKNSINIQDKIKSLKTKEKRIKELYIDGLIEKKEMLDKLDKIQKELHDLKQIESKSEKISFDDNAFEVYKGLDYEQKSIFWKSLIKEIEINKEREIKISVL